MKSLLYGKLHYHYSVYDVALSFFEKTDYLGNEVFYGKEAPKDMFSVFEFLEKEGMIKFERSGVSITEKGKAKIKSGGYRHQLLKERFIYLSICIGTITAIASIVISLCK